MRVVNSRVNKKSIEIDKRNNWQKNICKPQPQQKFVTFNATINLSLNKYGFDEC